MVCGLDHSELLYVHVHGKYVYSTLALEEIVKEETALRKEAVCCYMYMYIYIYINIYVCVCVYLSISFRTNKRGCRGSCVV